MKPDIHPKYNLCEVSCVCGNAFQTRSVKPAIKVDICNVCHPFYTGKQKLIDTAGRVEKFNKKFSKTGGKMITRKPKTKVKASVSPKHQKKVLSSAPKAKTAKDMKAAAKTEKKAEPTTEAK